MFAQWSVYYVGNLWFHFQFHLDGRLNEQKDLKGRLCVCEREREKIRERERERGRESERDR